MHHSPPTSRRMRLFSRCAWPTAAFRSAAGSRDSSYPAGGSVDEPPAAPAVAATVKSRAESTQRILVRFIAISLRDGLSLSKYLSEREVPKTWMARIPLKSRPVAGLEKIAAPVL